MKDSGIKELFGTKLSTVKIDSGYQSIGLNYNPFPRSGIADLNSSGDIILKLSPVNDEIRNTLVEYIVDSLFHSNNDLKDKYLSIVVRGEYGYGKTQTLLYTKSLIEYFQTDKEYHKNPYVVYIDNPGGKLTELIGSIISQIGEENFKRYLWNIVFERLGKANRIKDELIAFFDFANFLYKFEDFADPFNDKYVVNYKKFVDNLFKHLGRDQKKKKELTDRLKESILDVLSEEFENSIVAYFFYEILSETIGINKTWDAMTSGHLKELDKKEVYLIRAIVKILHKQGFTDFYILVDEFEAITATGRLSNSEMERYIANLRALIDKERNWCSVFAMTGQAYSKLKSISPPLADRIGGRIVDLLPLSDFTAQRLVTNYLNLARVDSASLKPFTTESIVKLNVLSNGILRIFLKSCYSLLQRAVEHNLKTISADFVEDFFVSTDEE